MIEKKLNALKVVLNKLEDYIKPKVYLEQYITPNDVVLDLFLILYNKFKKRKNKPAADFGSGTGRLSVMLLFLDFFVYSIEKDRDAFLVLNYNIKTYMKEYLDRIKLLNIDIRNFDKEVYLVVSNPPFGVKRRGQDRIFIKKALELGKYSYILGNPKSIILYKSLAREYNKDVNIVKYYNFKIEKQYPFHKKKEKIYKIALYEFY